MTAESGTKRRASVRYIIGGQVIFHTGSPDSSGGLVNIGRYGMLVRTHVHIPEGTELAIGLTVEGYPTPLQGNGCVVGARRDLLAIKFLGEPDRMTHLLQWLRQENVPWTGLDTLHSDQAVLSLPAATEPLAQPEQAEQRELEAILPFIEAMG
jgi:hypothetical protein